jgi:putative DNA primase/helicase
MSKTLLPRPNQQPSPLSFARSYLERGWSVIDLSAGTKKPHEEGWQELRLTPEQLPLRFNGTPKNVGVLLGEPSGGLTDVDVDCAEALALKTEFLPPTEATFGRPSNPESHLLYLTNIRHTVQFIDPRARGDKEKGMLIEVRSTGAQTVFPGSIHETGEFIDWVRDGEPRKIDGPLLQKMVSYLASASLFARHYPSPGGRHRFALALAGGLLRAGTKPTLAEHFIRAVATAAGDPEVHDRVRAVETTEARMNGGESFIGWPSASEIIGEDIIKVACRWLQIDASVVGDHEKYRELMANSAEAQAG